MLLHKRITFVLMLPLYAGLAIAQDPVDVERHYRGVAEKFCETRPSILNKCLDMSQAECEGLMMDVYTECDNDNPEEEGGIIEEKKFQECSENKFLSYISSKGIDPESECSL